MENVEITCNLPRTLWEQLLWQAQVEREDEITLLIRAIEQFLQKNGTAITNRNEYEGHLETLELLSTKGFRQTFEIAKAEADSGDTLSFEEVFGEPQ